MSDTTQDKITAVRSQLSARIIGADDTIEHALIAILSGGHLLLEGPPGLGKTQMGRALAEVMDMGFKRIQCTPDLSPSDIIGGLHADEQLGGRIFSAGPLFTNILLIDEINRAQPKTQSAFLEAMAEGAVTVGGATHRLPEPFLVIATQNPIDHEGTHPLPEAQEDRFLIKSYMTYLSHQDERQVIKSNSRGGQLKRILTPNEVMAIRQHIRDDVLIGDDIIDYIIALAAESRSRREVLAGASTRATVLYTQAAKAKAYLTGRSRVSPEDIVELAHPILRHRIVMNQDSRNFGYTADDLIDDILRKVKRPKDAI